MDCMNLLISALAPAMWRHSLIATMIMMPVMIFVSLSLSLAFSSLVFLLPAKWVNRGMISSDTTMVARIHMMKVARTVNHTLFRGSPRVLGNTPKNLL